MTTDYRALCAELLQAWDDLPWEYDFKGNPVGPLAEIDDTPFERARAALAQPEAEGPTDEDLLDAHDQAVAAFPPIHPEAEPLSVVEYARELEIRKARAVLARFARPAIEPVPVSERPWERNGWCDENGWCWGFDADDSDPYWIFDDPASCPCWTHLLPHYALPIPQ